MEQNISNAHRNGHSSHRRHRLVFLLQVFIWWGANNLFAIDAHYVLHKFDSSLIFIELTVIQIFVGLIMSSTLLYFFSPERHSRAPESSLLKTLTPFQILIGLVHLLGTVFTNASYLLIGSTSTLVWKLTEPLSALLLRRLILNEYTSSITIVGILLVVSGVLLFSVNSLPLFSLSPIILANLSFPIRNVLVKKDQASSNDLTTHERYYLLLSSTLPVCVLMMIWVVLQSGTTFEAYPLLARNAILFNSYQIASIALLERMDTLTHSLANTMKRFTGIILSFIALGEILEVKHVMGLTLTMIGFPLYIVGKLNKDVWGKTKLKVSLRGYDARVSLLILLGMGMIGMLYSNVNSILPESARTISVQEVFAMNRTISTNTSREWFDAPVVNDARRLGFRNLPSDLPINLLSAYAVQKAITYNSYKEALTRPTKNLGDMVWQYSSYIRLPNISDKHLCKSFKSCERKGRTGKMLMYRPSANLFNNRREHNFKFEINLMNKGDIPFIVGIGTQAYFTHETRNRTVKGNDLNPDGIISETPETYDLRPGPKRLLALLQKNRHPVLVRGKHTLKVMQLAGYHYGIATGCPSLMMNEEVHLGTTMQRKYDALLKREGDFSLKVAININGFPRLLNLLLEIFYKYPNSLIYAQGVDDIERLNYHKIPFDRIRIFTNLDKWMESISKMDVSIGARIHGNMIALGNSVPVFVMAPDFRVLELAQIMKIPYMHIFDKRWKSRTLDVVSILRNSPFDGAMFDKNRCDIAKLYRYTFLTQGLQLNDHVKRISEIC